MLDLTIVISYFGIILFMALRGRAKGELTVDEFYLSSRNLTWPSIALSTIATNIQGYQFLGMMGSAYLFGIAQANLEINAMQGILLAAFVFVPLYLKDRIITITQFIKKRLGEKVALFYSLSNIVMFSTITLGAALFWGAYAADLIFSDYLQFIHQDRIVRISIIIIGLGIFSASYTYLGGLTAVVKTDVIQFFILLIGGFVVLFVSIHHLGGWSQLYVKAPDHMHLHLPMDHPKLPWTHMVGLFFLNINYWCANQSVMQRSLAAKNLKHAQAGLMVGGLMKYVMAIIIIVPGVALYGILGDLGLSDPDMAFPHIVSNYLPIGVKGIILCALFASLMSTIDSTFNSLATLWSIDIYKGFINKEADDRRIVGSGKKAILFSLCTGILMGLVFLYIKFNDPGSAFTHTLNELRYYINCGIVVLIISAASILLPDEKKILTIFILTIPLNILIKGVFPEINYFVRAGLVIITALIFVYITHFKNEKVNLIEMFKPDNDALKRTGILLAFSLLILHLIFH